MKLRSVFMGTPEFSVPSLEALAEVTEIIGVFTQPDSPAGRGQELKQPPVKVRAQALGIPIFQPKRVSLSPAFEELEALRPELIVVAAYAQMLKSNVLKLPKLGCINVHPSLLPRWRGAAPIQWPILAGDQGTGVTIMSMIDRLDAGDILAQERVELTPASTAKVLHDDLARLGARMLKPVIEGLVAGKLLGQPQNDSQATYAKKLEKSMQWLDPLSPVAELDRRVRALNPWPGTSIMTGEKARFDRLRVLSAKLRVDLKGFPGELFERAGMIFLGASDGCLELLEIQWEGRKPQNPMEFLNGLRGAGRTLPFRISSPT